MSIMPTPLPPQAEKTTEQGNDIPLLGIPLLQNAMLRSAVNDFCKALRRDVEHPISFGVNPTEISIFFGGSPLGKIFELSCQGEYTDQNGQTQPAFHALREVTQGIPVHNLRGRDSARNQDGPKDKNGNEIIVDGGFTPVGPNGWHTYIIPFIPQDETRDQSSPAPGA